MDLSHFNFNLRTIDESDKLCANHGHNALTYDTLHMTLPLEPSSTPSPAHAGSLCYPDEHPNEEPEA